ncbi:hypothetical protein BDA99DRAFT_544573 [Phascolomyces articulosus]|uniref:Tc1-like transposase DDE domain-containing protein n=1 Tax=Phascolomyces articulosus TaxID=60185 RepID=A0AAD5JYK2_9FUNG|nr:hypothetical protein BDA99DRAFT_544573 [Phascolomyces articulosus]
MSKYKPPIEEEKKEVKIPKPVEYESGSDDDEWSDEEMTYKELEGPLNSPYSSFKVCLKELEGGFMELEGGSLYSPMKVDLFACKGSLCSSMKVSLFAYKGSLCSPMNVSLFTCKGSLCSPMKHMLYKLSKQTTSIKHGTPLTEEMSAADTLSRMSEAPGSVSRLMRNFSELSFDELTTIHTKINALVYLGPYNRQDLDNASEAIRELQQGKSSLQVAKENNIKYSTFRDQQNGPAKRELNVNDAMYKFLLRFVDQHSVTGHHEIYAEFMRKFKDVDAMEEKLKKGVDPKRCIFVGEGAYDTNVRRTYVDLKQQEGRKAKAEAEGRKYEPRVKKEWDQLAPFLVSLVAASPTEILYHTVKYFKGPTDERNIRQFLQRILSLMDVSDHIDKEWSIIFDDAQEETKIMLSDTVRQRGYKVFFLPPCEETINPIDGLFHDIVELRYNRKALEKNDLLDNCENRMTKVIHSLKTTEINNIFKYYFECGCEDCLDRFY